MADPSPRRRQLLIALVFLGTALNYVDRQVLALLKPTLVATFGWDDVAVAHLGSARQQGARWVRPPTGTEVPAARQRPARDRTPAATRRWRRRPSRRMLHPWTAHREGNAYSRRPPIPLDAARRWAEA
jgi:hypothetical protein